MNSDQSAVRTVLFVNPTAAFYGAERSLLDIVNVMNPGWRPWFVVPEKGPYTTELELANYPLDVVEVPRKPFHNRARFRLAVQHLAWIILKRRARLIHANLQWAVPLVAASSRLTGVPFVAHLRNMAPKVLDQSIKAPFRQTSAIICISRAVCASAFASGMLSPELRDRTWVIPDGRNLSNYMHGDRARIRAELGIGEADPLIGMVARIEPMKGQHIFLEAAALVAERMPSARFLLVGDIMGTWHQRYLEMLKRRCEDPRLKPRVIFWGYRKDVPNILAALDCFMHPSLRGAFVSVLIEVMAAGIPLVVSGVDGIPECVGREGGAEIIDNLQPANFANAIMQIIRDPTRRSRMSLAGRERAKRYDAVYLARETERVFETCLAQLEICSARFCEH